jgi:hypothetical protein
MLFNIVLYYTKLSFKNKNGTVKIRWREERKNRSAMQYSYYNKPVIRSAKTENW